MAEELTFHLEDFDGPLELLLALVAKHKMDLHNIPILELIDQYTRPVSFRTTDTFLRVFGLSSLADLPPVHQPEAPAESEG